MSGQLKIVKSLPWWVNPAFAGRGVSLSAYQALLLGDWEMNESSGGRLDSSQYGYGLTDNNTVASGTGVATNDATAAVFVAGNSEYLSRSAGTMPAIENRTDNFSIEMALKVNGGIGSVQTFVGKGATANNIAGFWCQMATTGRFQITLGNGTSRISVTPTNVFSTGTLYHIICTVDRTGNMTVYYNNALGAGTAAFSVAGIPGNLGNSTPLTIGGLTGSTYSSIDMGFVRIWNKVLDSTDRSYLYNSGNLRSYAQL